MTRTKRQLTVAQRLRLWRAIAHWAKRLGDFAAADEAASALDDVVDQLIGERLASAIVPDAMPPLYEIEAERRRQVQTEGYSCAHDDEHDDGSIARAAACYALAGGKVVKTLWMRHWPWDTAAFKPKDARRNLVRAGALILAELERLDRAAARKSAR